MKGITRKLPYAWLIVMLLAAGLSVWVIKKLDRANLGEHHFQKFVSLIELAQFPEAQPEIEKAIRLSPDNAYYISGQALLHQRMMQARFDPEAYVANRLSLSEEDHRHVKAAISAYERAIELNPNDGCFNHNVGWLYSFLNDKQKALQFFMRAVEIDGANGLYRGSLALFYEQSALSEDAERQYFLAVCLSPGVLDSRFFSDFNRRSPAGAERVVSESISYLEARVRQGGDSAFKAKLGKLYLYKNERGAAEMLKEATTKLPNLSRPWLYLGKVYANQSNSEEAKRCYEKAAFLDATGFLAQHELGRLYERDQKTADAIRWYQSAASNWLSKTSSSARKALRIYLAAHVVRDDIVPEGLLSYFEPSFDFAGTCMRLSGLYRETGNAERANYYDHLSRSSTF